MSAGRIVALEGPSASGKTTLARRLATRIAGRSLDEALLRIHPPPSLRFATARELVALERRLLRAEVKRWTEAVRLAGRGIPVVLDTGPFGPLTYTYGLVRAGEAPGSALSSIVSEVRRLLKAGKLGIPDRTLYLEVPVSARRARAGRTRRHGPVDLFERHVRVAREERELLLGPWRAPLRVRPLRVATGETPSTTLRRLAATLAVETDGPVDRRPAGAATQRAFWAPFARPFAYAGSESPDSPAASRS